MAVALFCAGLVVTSDSAAQSGQRPLPVVAVSCGSDLRLCQALVQSLAEKAPSYLYRINPTPRPSAAFDLRLELGTSGDARLVWPGGAGETISRNGQAETEFARHIVEASPALADALSSSW